MDCCRDKKTIFQRINSIFADKGNKADSNKYIPGKVVLVGSPNVGKSVIFNGLTGAYVTVSNYPGTTVEVSRGWYSDGDRKFEIIDTPGMYSMVPITEEERVTRSLLMSERPDLVIHVADAKNIGRMLPLTLQLMEAGLPVVLVLNIMDEAKSLGVNIDFRKLEKLLGIPVIEASAALNMGIREIKDTIVNRIKSAA